MKNAFAYYLLCRVWLYLMTRDSEASEIVSKLKFSVIREGFTGGDMFHLAGSIVRWSGSKDLNHILEHVGGDL